MSVTSGPTVQRRTDRTRWSVGPVRRTMSEAEFNRLHPVLQTAPMALSQLILPQFGGRLHEDPEDFLVTCERQFAICRTPEMHKVHLAGLQLQDQAASWWKNLQSFITTWPRFADRLSKKFASPHALAILRAQLYGERQGPHEPVEAFLLKKEQLLQRLEPGTPEMYNIEVLIELVRPAIRPFLRAPPVDSIAEMIDRAVLVERDLADDAMTTREPPLRCRYCFGPHYNKDCPQQRGSHNQQGGSENSQRARDSLQTTRPLVEGSRPAHVHMAQFTDVNPVPLTPRVTCTVNQRTANALIDTAASHNFIKTSLLQRGQMRATGPSSAQLASAGARMKIRGCAPLEVNAGGSKMMTEFLVTDELHEDVLLGVPWLTAQQAVCDFQQACVHVGKQNRSTLHFTPPNTVRESEDHPTCEPPRRTSSSHQNAPSVKGSNWIPHRVHDPLGGDRTAL